MTLVRDAQRDGLDASQRVVDRLAENEEVAVVQRQPLADVRAKWDRLAVADDGRAVRGAEVGNDAVLVGAGPDPLELGVRATDDGAVEETCVSKPRRSLRIARPQSSGLANAHRDRQANAPFVSAGLRSAAVAEARPSTTRPSELSRRLTSAPKADRMSVDEDMARATAVGGQWEWIGG